MATKQKSKAAAKAKAKVETKTTTKVDAKLETKSEATRRLLLERALGLFQKRGVEATTMRDIAKAAGMSLGAAYYYFPSKEALVFAYYEDTQTEMERLADRASGDVHARVAHVLHGKLEAIRPHKKMLAAIVQRLADPSDPVGAFSAQTRAVRERAIAVFARALDGAALEDGVRALAARVLWLFHLAVMLVFVNDDSEGETRTHRLVDDALALFVPILPMLETPMGATIAERVTKMLARARIV